MPAGGPNEIDNISVGISADLAELSRGLDQAQQQAGQKGRDAGQAWSQGFAAASSGGGMYGGGVMGPGVPSGGGGGGGAAPSGGGPSGQSSLVALNTGISAVMSIVSQLRQFETVGEDIGNNIFRGAKQMMEVSQAIERSTQAMARTAAMQEEFWSKRTSADASIDPAQLARLIAREMEMTDAQKAVTGASNVQQAVEWVAKQVPAMAGGDKLVAMTALGQAREHLTELQREADAERRATAGIGKRQHERGLTFGGTLERAAAEAGIPIPEPGRLQPGGSLGIAEAEVLLYEMRQSRELLQQMLRLNTGTVRDQQKALLEMIRGVESPSRAPME